MMLAGAEGDDVVSGVDEKRYQEIKMVSFLGILAAKLAAEAGLEVIENQSHNGQTELTSP